MFPWYGIQMSEPNTTPDATPPVNPVISVLTGTEPVVRWLLPDFVAQGSLILWAGEPGSGKSYACYTLGLACAAGVPLLGYAPGRPLRVLYFDQENSRPDRDQYLRWAWNGLGRPSLERIAQNFWTQHFTLGTADWAQRASHAVQQTQPDLIFVDTASPACAILDENDNGIATQTVNKLRAIMNVVPYTAAMIVLKHSRIITEDGPQGGQEPRRAIRGAKAWAGMSDAVWFHVKGFGTGVRDDGLSPTYITPAKTRAFGLRRTIRIDPQWVNRHVSGEGIRLNMAR